MKIDISKELSSGLLSKAFILLPVLFYPPLLFVNKLSSSLRIGSLIILVVYLYLAVRRFRIKDCLIFLLLAYLSLTMLAVNFDDLNKLRTAGGVMLTLIFAHALSRAVEINIAFKKNLIALYVLSFMLIPLSSILSLIFILIFGEFNLFNLVSEGQSYLYTPFGALLHKDFWGLHVYRTFSFFQEPVYLGLIYATNIFLIAPHLIKNSFPFVVLNIIGGILTFSFIFLAWAAFLILVKPFAVSRKYMLTSILLIVILLFISSTTDILDASSLSDRIERAGLFFESVKESSAIQLVWGHGFKHDTGFDKGFCAGLLTAIYEVGIINSITIMLFLIILSNNNTYILLLFFVSLLLFESIKLPLFWVLVIVLSVLLPNESYSKKTKFF